MIENPNFSTPQTRFLAKVWLRDRLLAKGLGGSKKRAEQAAAKEAFLSLKD